MWRPRTYDEMEQAIGVVAEAPDIDFKREVPSNREFAKDLAAMTIAGGVLVFGVEETKEGLAAKVCPVPLTGTRERLQQIADSAVRPTPPIEIEVLKRQHEEANGVVVVYVPPSPMAPHQANDRYPARADTTTRYLSEPEVAALYEQRRRLAERVLSHAPLEGFLTPPNGLSSGSGFVGIGAVRLYLRPVVDLRHPRGPWLGSALADAVRRARERVDRLSLFVPPATWDWLASWSPRGTIGWQAGEAADQFEVLREHKLVAATVTHECELSALATLGLEVQGGGQTCTYEQIVVAELLALVALAGELLADVSNAALVILDLQLAGFEGSVPYTLSRAQAIHSSQPRVADNAYTESVQVGVSELRGDPRPLIRRLLDRFFASVLPEGTDVVGHVARGADSPLSDAVPPP